MTSNTNKFRKTLDAIGNVRMHVDERTMIIYDNLVGIMSDT
jgi:hypothetical protein